ncbi:DUF418 domain-containing protein [Metasolibacillus meyeri]|uniref:DUF418 domain-containing protein n=1 Tax=Metasolibacillus meyeri TaxID=1071052 RepID=A0AAW9NRK3_9BACL|nr:DUF418 domain-containing protein [Metasolibacillus meyeri]MEC1180337.1 DUF418 domain-containing protein [Metasolibacillus meyeri]
MESRKGRIHTIDGIRGLSLFGILCANMLIFQYGMYGQSKMEVFHISMFDHWVNDFLSIVFVGSSMPIFTFLFGYSLVMMGSSLERKELPVKWSLFKRAIFLIILGVLHSTYLWEGDILLMYGILSIFLLVFVRRRAKTILICAIGLCLILGGLAFMGMMNGPEEVLNELSNPQDLIPYIEKTTEVYSSGTYAEIKEYRNNVYPPEGDTSEKGTFGGKFAMMFLGILVIMPMFLIGMYAAKKQWFVDVAEKGKRYRTLAITFIVGGLVLKGYAQFAVEGVLKETGGLIGPFMLSFGYIFLMALLYTNVSFRNKLKGFEAVGKLSLTNYILQTVICTTIFYGYGFGLFGKLGVTLGFVLSIIIYTLQVVGSYYYLQHFKTGPLEFINRKWVYFSLKRKKKRPILEEQIL